MKKIYLLFFVGFLFALNIFCWKEVFVLASNNDLKVVYFDVGQGDSVFIETPQRHQVLIDGGPTPVVLSKLAKEMPFWDRTIDLVILSHPEKDHMAGLLDVLQRYKADYILWSGVVRSSSEYQKWIEVLEKQKKMGTKIIIAESNQRIAVGESFIDILHPFDNLVGNDSKDSNDTSVVFDLTFYENSFLFVGDISSSLEKKLVNSGINLTSNVLKVAHHGSKYSTSDIFLENVKPEVAIISVGENSYGHPTPEVLQRLDDFEVKTLRTDQIGDITILSDGENLKIKNN
jgi:competence protein ComEC